MRTLLIRTTYSVATLLWLASAVDAGVRGRPVNLKPPTAARVAQSDSLPSVNSVPVPADVNVTSETIIRETTVNPAVNLSPMQANCAPQMPAVVGTPTYMAMPVVAMPLMTPAVTYAPPMVPMRAPGCCGNTPMGLSPAAAAAYEQAFGPGLYRSGAEAGQLHFPYYSYRRPWYFPGQPSFHRSTDYVW